MAMDPAMTVGAFRKRKRPPSDVLVVPGADDGNIAVVVNAAS